MKRNFTYQQIRQADNLINKKHKIYFPWHQKFIYRVVKKDHEGYYIRYKNERVKCIPKLDGLDKNVIGFIALKGGR